MRKTILPRHVTMPSNDLPGDVVIDILLRLPVKTLIRLRCACKSWYATITHPSFVSTHLNRASSCHADNFLEGFWYKSNYEEKYWSLWSLDSDQRYVDHVTVKVPIEGHFEDLVSYGTMNGITCLTSQESVYLWNPSIRKLKTLPCSSMAPQYSKYEGHVHLAFGFHHQTNDYKVVRIRYSRDVKSILEPPPQVEVYKLSTDSWRRIEAVVPPFLYITSLRSSTETFVNGSAHWLAYRPATLFGNYDRLVSFDIGDELFREMKLPDYHIGRLERNSKLQLGVLKESLSLCVSCCRSGCCHIWVMREYGVVESWTKLFTIAVPEGIVERSLGFTKSNELVLEMGHKFKFVLFPLSSYDPESLQFKDLPFQMYKYKMVSFVETLVLLGSSDALLGQENLFDGVSTGDSPRKEEVERSHVKRRKA